MTVTLRPVTDPADPAIAAFGRLQENAYFEPDMLIPAQYIGQMLGEVGGRHNFLLVAEEDGTLLGGTLFHYLAPPGTGFSSFMAVDREARGRGIARQLHEERFRLLDAAAGGAVPGGTVPGRTVPGVFIDVVNPARLSAEELVREKAVGSDPTARRRAFAKLGFLQVDLRYEQPVGGRGGGPVTNMDLLFCPHEPGLDRLPVQLVADTMRAYWTSWMGPQRAAKYAAELAARADGREEVALISPTLE